MKQIPTTLGAPSCDATGNHLPPLGSAAPISTPLGGAPIFEPHPRWPGAPPVCLYENLLAFPSAAALQRLPRAILPLCDHWRGLAVPPLQSMALRIDRDAGIRGILWNTAAMRDASAALPKGDDMSNLIQLLSPFNDIPVGTPPWIRSKIHAKRRKLRLESARKIETHTKEQWLILIQELGGVCAKCLSTGPLQKDHIVPIYRGGSDSINNLQPLCSSCNASKGPDETNWVNIRRNK